MTDLPPNVARAASLIATGPSRALDEAVVDATKRCLLDWLGCALGARDEPSGRTVRATVARWRATGDAVTLYGARTAPALAAMANGTLAHCLDFDDTHASSVAHLGAPSWAAVLATSPGRTESEVLAAFAVAYEVGAGFGGGGFGIEVDHAGWHSTGVFGALAAAAGAARSMRLDGAAAAHALAAAATQVGGLTGSFGTMAKPFHAGKAAFHGVLSAELAADGFVAAPRLLAPDGGLVQAFGDTAAAAMREGAFADACDAVLGNTFKPYACCLLTHASVDAARAARAHGGGRAIAGVVATVSPLATRLASIAAPTTPLEGKFSTAYCVALGLAGHAASREDFTAARLDDPALRALTLKTTLVADASLPETASRLSVRYVDGSTFETVVPLARGNPDNPMGWDDLRDKFDALVAPVVGRANADALHALVRGFERPGSVERMWALIEHVERS